MRTPREGTVQEWITSHPVICAFISGLSGTITPFVAVIMRLVVSSILNSRKVGAKLLARGDLLTSALFWWARLFIRLKSRKEKLLLLPLRSSVLIRRLLSKSSVPKRLFSFWYRSMVAWAPKEGNLVCTELPTTFCKLEYSNKPAKFSL